jgi:hypothetical protein
MGSTKRLRVEPALCALRWGDVVNQYVRILEQVVQYFPPFVGSQIRYDTAFIRI